MVLSYCDLSSLCGCAFFILLSLSINVCWMSIDAADGWIRITSSVIHLKSRCHLSPQTIFPFALLLSLSPKVVSGAGGSDPSRCPVHPSTQALLAPPFFPISPTSPVQTPKIPRWLGFSGFPLVFFSPQFIMSKAALSRAWPDCDTLSSDTLHGSSSPPNEIVSTGKAFHKPAPPHTRITRKCSSH